MDEDRKNIEPDLDLDDEEEDSSLPAVEDAAETALPLADGQDAIARHARHAPSAPGVYRMIDARGEVLYVGKAKNIRKRILAYRRPGGHATRIARTIAALERAFLIRSCSNAVYESRTRPCLLHQIKRCSAPCTGEIAHSAYAELVREAKTFLSGRSRAVKEELAAEMEKASAALDFE